VQRIGLAVALLALPAAAGIGWFVARRLTDHSQAIIASGTVKGMTFEHHLARLIAGIVAVVLVLVLTASGLGSVIGWAVRLALTQIVAAWSLLIRALPVVLLSVLVLFNTAVWAMAASLSTARFGLALGYPIPVPQALIQMTLFLGALTFMYVSVRAVGDGEYRYQFSTRLLMTSN
jgi:hypothetical protein